MMSTEFFLLTPETIGPWVAALLHEQRVLAPTRREDGLCDFAWIEKAGQVDLSCGIPRLSAKQALLPRAEVLFYYQRDKQGEKMTAPPAPNTQIILGLHPCDVQAVKVLDTVFGAQPAPDQLYLARRAKTILIGKGSLSDEPHVFARELGIDPMDSRDCDAFLAPLPDGRWLLELLTDKGLQLKPMCSELPAPDAKDLRIVAKAREQSRQQVSNPFDMEAVQKGLLSLFESEIWDLWHDTCVGCGACTFLCPTCHCFDIQEETRGTNGARVRVWDTCQFGLFTRHASGHNPRGSQKERLRQRIMHKFSYGMERFHIPFCIGCGRCIVACPTRTSIHQALEKIHAVIKQPDAIDNRSE